MLPTLNYPQYTDLIILTDGSNKKKWNGKTAGQRSVQIQLIIRIKQAKHSGQNFWMFSYLMIHYGVHKKK